MALFRQCAAVSVACHWAWAGLGRTKILEGKLAEAASHIQQVGGLAVCMGLPPRGRATGCSEVYVCRSKGKRVYVLGVCIYVL